MFNLNNFLGVTFFERLRAPTQQDLEEFEERLLAEDAEDAEIRDYARSYGDDIFDFEPSTAQERMLLSRDYLNRPAIKAKAICLTETKEDIEGIFQYGYTMEINDAEKARALKRAISTTFNWGSFGEINDGLDCEKTFINFNNAAAVQAKKGDVGCDFLIADSRETPFPFPPNQRIELPFRSVFLQLADMRRITGDDSKFEGNKVTIALQHPKPKAFH